MDARTEERRAAIPALTGLRFVAALLVYASHMDWRGSPLPSLPARFAASGFNGVTLFFVLSGFVLTYNYHDAMGAGMGRALWPFFVARFARVYPLYLFTFLWVLSTMNINQQVTRGYGYPTVAGRGWWQIVDQVTLTQAWYPNVYRAFNYNTVAWSVSVEAFLYLLFPLIALLLSRLRTTRQHLVLAAVAVAVPIATATAFTLSGRTNFFGIAHYVLYRLPAMRLPDFILGCVAARLYMLSADRPMTQRESRIAAFALALAALVVVAVMAGPPVLTGPLVPFRFDAAYLVPFAVIIFCLARYRTYASRALSTPVMVRLGEASYAFYLLHALLLAMLRDWQVGLGMKTALLHHAVVLVLITTFAVGAHVCIEEPARRRIRAALTRRVRPAAQRPPVATKTRDEPIPALSD